MQRSLTALVPYAYKFKREMSVNMLEIYYLIIITRNSSRRQQHYYRDNIEYMTGTLYIVLSVQT
jgi:hypothetical protein